MDADIADQDHEVSTLTGRVKELEIEAHQHEYTKRLCLNQSEGSRDLKTSCASTITPWTEYGYNSFRWWDGSSSTITASKCYQIPKVELWVIYDRPSDRTRWYDWKQWTWNILLTLQGLASAGYSYHCCMYGFQNQWQQILARRTIRSNLPGRSCL